MRAIHLLSNLSLSFLIVIIKPSSCLRPSSFGMNDVPDSASNYRRQVTNTSDNNHYKLTQDSSYDNIPNFDTLGVEDRQSVEERLAQWRADQQYKYETQTPLDEANPRDDMGRMKLLASVSRGSISLFFFILMWRSIHHYELADVSFKNNNPSIRLSLVIPPCLLFIGNLAACVASFTSSTSSSSKKKMKAVLNLNKMMEISLFVYNMMRLTVFPSRYVMREIFVGRILTNFLFLVQLQLFTKVTWGGTKAIHQTDVITPSYRQNNDTWRSDAIENQENGGSYYDERVPDDSYDFDYGQQNASSQGSWMDERDNRY